MKIRILFLALALVFLSSITQAKTAFAQQVTVNSSTPGGGQAVTITDPYGGTYSAYLHLPSDYATSTKTYPLLIFLHGMGEAGTDLSLIYNNSYAGGPAYLVEHGLFPKFTNPITGQQTEFIVLAPQATYFSTSGFALNNLLQGFIPKYRVDTSRIYPTGLSAGGQGVVEFMVHTTWANKYTAAAAVPMSEAWYYPSNAPNVIVGDNVYNWGFGSDPQDQFGVLTHQLMDGINAISPGMARYTNYSGGHCCWNTYYDPAYRETINGKSMDIYEWLLQYARGSNPTSTAPVAYAGPNQTITLPTSSVTLTGVGTDANGTIVSYSWNKQSGTGGTIISPTSVSTVVSGLTAGVYTYRFTVTDNSGLTSYSDVVITVNPAPAPTGVLAPYGGTARPIPGTIEAEDFDAGGEGIAYHDLDAANQGGKYRPTEGVDIESATGDTSGTYDVGWINSGEWMKYEVNVQSTGTYTLQARVAALGADTFNVEMDGTVIATVNVPATGGYQVWQTVSIPNISLTQGNHTMRVVATSNGFNINYLTFVAAAAPVVNTPPVANAGPDQTITLPTNSVTLTGSGTDANGTISSYAWSQVSGGSATITSPSSASTTITGLAQGSYTFRLTVTDNNGATATDDMIVTVLAAPITPPTTTASSGVFNIDFGLSTAQTTTTGWNNVTNPATGTTVALVDSTGATTPVKLQITDSFYYNSGNTTDASVNPNGTTSSTLFPASATRDSFFLGSLNGLTDTSATMTVSGLNNTSTYDFRFYASRVAGDNSNRTTDYTINGKTVTLNATNNLNSYVDITGIAPSNGSIVITVARDAAANFGYLGVMQVTEHPSTTVTAPTNTPPVANAGPDQTITLPTSSVTLTGSGTDANGTIAGYVWSFISGPATPTIASATSASTTASGLSTAGSYTFRLTVTDNNGATATDDMIVTVAPAPVVVTPPTTTTTGATIPGTIQAEDFNTGGEGVGYHDFDTANQGGQYRTTEGVDIEKTQDTTGTYDVGWIYTSEWMKYNVNVQTTGTYTFQVRAAAPTGGSFNLEMDGTVLASVTIPATGSYQSWQTVSVPSLSLTQGSHVMRIIATSNGINLNYYTFSQVLGAYSGDPASAVYVTAKGKANVRSAPKTGKIIGKVPHGMGGTIIIDSPTWPKVTFQNGLTGYISRALLGLQIKRK